MKNLDRDQFAAAALTGLLAAPTCKDRSWDYWARIAYEAADAMLAERAKTNHDTAPQPTLTSAEREALHWVIGEVADITEPVENTLRGLLERVDRA
jgi:hypothetical protein